MSYRALFAIAAVLGVLGATTGGIGLAGSGFSARSYVSSHYSRAARYDIGRDAVAYTAARSPALVSQEISRAWKPTYNYRDTSGYYLRYGNDSVVVKPQGSGSLILLENMRTANARYGPVVGSNWHYSTRQNTNRGGGSGTGK